MRFHHRMNKIGIITISFALIIAGVLGLTIKGKEGNLVINLISLAGTIFGTVFIAIELMQTSNVTCCDLLIQQNNYFHDNEKLMKVYSALEYELQHPGEPDRDKYLRECDLTDLTAYCTFFENIYLLVNNNIASMSSLDDLFAYRFFLFMHSEYFQEKEILPVCSSYIQLFELYKIWYKYRLKKHTEHLIVSKENKLSYEYLHYKYYKSNDRGFARPVVYSFESEGKTYKIYHEIYDYMDEILDLQKNVYEKLENKELYVPSSREELIISMQLDRIYTIWDGNNLAGYFIVVLNRDNHRNYVNFLDEKDIKFNEVFTFDSIVIAPEYRGKHLQQKALEFTTNLAKETEGVKYILATASEENVYSIKNFEKSGYTHYKDKVKLYGDKTRSILLKTL